MMKLTIYLDNVIFVVEVNETAKKKKEKENPVEEMSDRFLEKNMTVRSYPPNNIANTCAIVFFDGNFSALKLFLKSNFPLPYLLQSKALASPFGG